MDVSSLAGIVHKLDPFVLQRHSPPTSSLLEEFGIAEQCRSGSQGCTCSNVQSYYVHIDKSGMSSAGTQHPVADLGGVRGVQMHPPLAASNVFCVHNCTSPSNDYAAVACSNNNQAQLHTHVSVPY